MKKLFLAISLLISALCSGQVGAVVATGYTYMVEKSGTKYFARPRPSNGIGFPTYSGTDAYTVIQAAITKIADTGSLHISAGTYTLTNELTIIGKGTSFVPYRSIKITGDGFSTQLIQNTAGKNGIVIKNRAGVNMSNLFISCGSSARSALLLDSTGANTEVSVYQSAFNYLYLTSTSSTYPALSAKNFWYSDFTNISAVNVNNDAIVLSNASNADTHYGNSSFGQIYVVSSESTGFAGLRITTGTNVNHGYLDHCTVDNFEYGDLGDFAIYTTACLNFKFNLIDVENAHHPIALGREGGITQGCTFDNAFLIVNSSANDTAISIGSTSGSNVFRNCKIVGDATTVPVRDQLTANANAPNSYDLWLGTNVYPSKIAITWASNTPLITRSAALGTTMIMGGDSTSLQTPFMLGGVSVLPTGTELNFVDGVTSAIQTQIDTKKANSDSTAQTGYTSRYRHGQDSLGLKNAIDLKAPLASPTLTGTPAAPTATAGTNTTQLATTAFVATSLIISSASTHTSLNPADNTLYYFGPSATAFAAATVVNNRAYAVPANCTLIGYMIGLWSNSAPTSENSTFSIRINNTTDVQLTNAASFGSTAMLQTSYYSMAMSTAMNAGDKYEIKWQTPVGGWTTNPTTVQVVVTLYFRLNGFGFFVIMIVIPTLIMRRKKWFNQEMKNAV